MSKAATIASLVRVAAKTEMEFAQTIQQVLDEGDVERAAEFFDRVNIPRSVGLDDPNNPVAPLRVINAKADHISSYEAEKELSAGLQKFLDRHERKIKWHATHPGIDGVQNVLLLYRCALALTERTLGFRLPVEGLAAWIRAAPHTDAAYSIETDREGRVSLLRQAGWEIVYDYPDPPARRPVRLRLTYPDLEIRMVIDRWE